MAATLEYRYTGSAVVAGEIIGTGDGATLTFSATLANPPVAAGSVVISYTIGGTAYTATDNGLGTITGTDLSGTINYTTGEVSLTFTVAPDAATDITADYHAPSLSLGGAATTATVSTTAMNNIFDNVDPTEASTGDTEYRAISIYNSGDATAVSVALYMNPETTSASTQLNFWIEGIDPVSPLTIVDESDSTDVLAGAGAVFTHNDAASKLTVLDIPAGSEARLWLQRVVTAGAANLASDTGTINVDYA